MHSKTILQALQDEIHYPLGVGYIENRLLSRGLEAGATATAEALSSPAFVGAVADCLASLVQAPNWSEGDKSISLGDRGAILRRANALYRSIGEAERVTDEARPSVTILS